MTEIRQLVRDMAVAIANSELSALDIPTLESFDDFRFSNDAEAFVCMATAALLVALPRIGEMAEAAADDGYWSAIDHKGMAGTGKAIKSSIRASLSTLETELRKGDDHG